MADRLMGPTVLPALYAEGEHEAILGVKWEKGIPTFANAPTGSSVGSAVVWSPDGSRLATISSLKVVRIWDARTRKQIQRWQGTSGRWPELSYTYDKATWSPDGNTLSVGDQLWDVATGKVLQRLATPGTGIVTPGARSPDGSTVASGSSAGLRLLEAATGNQRIRVEDFCHVTSVAWSPAGNSLAFACLAGSARLLDVSVGMDLGRLEGYSHAVQSVAWSPDGRMLASGDDHRTIHFWEIETGKEVMRFEAHRNWVTSVAWSPDGKVLASGGLDGTLLLWNVAAGEETRRLAGHAGGIFAVVWSPDGKRLASGHGDKTVRLWDSGTGKELSRFRGHSEPVYALAWSEDGTRLASGSIDKTVRVWDANSGRELKRFEMDAWVTSVAWSPDSKAIAAGSLLGNVHLWDNEGSTERKYDLWHVEPARLVAWAPNGKSAAWGRDSDVSVWWDADKGRILGWFRGHSGKVNAIAWSPDSKTFVSGGEDGTLRFWKVQGEDAEPAAAYWASCDGWVSWRADAPAEHRVLRGETGNLIRRPNPGGVLSSILPPSGQHPQLSASVTFVHPAGPSAVGEIRVRVNNAKDATEAIWVELYGADDPASPLVKRVALSFPPIHIRLDPGASAELPVGYALQGGGITTGSIKKVLELHHAHDGGKGIAVPVELKFVGL